MTNWFTTWLLTTVVAVGLVLPPVTHAQKVTLPAQVIRSSPDLSVSKRQLRMAAELGRRVLLDLEAASSNIDSPIDQNLIQNARNTYVLIRAAKEGLEATEYRREVAVNGSMTAPDPVLELIHERVVDAWNLARTPVDMNPDPRRAAVDRPRYLETSIRDLRRALQLVDQALVLLP